MLSYPNDALFKIPAEHNGIISLFKDLLATFRIISTNEIPPSLGNIAFNIYSTTEIGGANARQSLFGYYYFGFMGSLLFSFFFRTNYVIFLGMFFLELKKLHHWRWECSVILF
uniref:Uncharacterized protein n=1 Tax=Escherichia coli TaxID=562 RepID=A0A6N0IQZ7_ECOLX|nr:hypothetical protein HPE44_22495 [Escherichia coli]